jgi:hypothetical protein
MMANIKMIEVLYDMLPRKFVMYMINWRTLETIEVKKFLAKNLEDNYYYLKLIVDTNNLVGETDDDTVVNIIKWVHANIKYTSDKLQYKTTEYWATVQETILSRMGDCDDGAILTFCMCRAAGIPESRVFIATGEVDDFQGGTAGHCWVRYVSDKYQLVVYYLDWCYLYSGTRIPKRTAYMEDDNRIAIPTNSSYLNYWFIANDKGGFRW